MATVTCARRLEYARAHYWYIVRANFKKEKMLDIWFTVLLLTAGSVSLIRAEAQSDKPPKQYAIQVQVGTHSREMCDFDSVLDSSEFWH